jgi:hypothetical protein
MILGFKGFILEQGANSRNVKSQRARGVGLGSQPVVRWKVVQRGKYPLRGTSNVRCIEDLIVDLSSVISLNKELGFILMSDMRTPKMRNPDVPFRV